MLHVFEGAHIERRKRKEDISTFALRAHSTLSLYGCRNNICYRTLRQLLDFLITEVTTSQHYIIFTF